MVSASISCASMLRVASQSISSFVRLRSLRSFVVNSVLSVVSSVSKILEAQLVFHRHSPPRRIDTPADAPIVPIGQILDVDGHLMPARPENRANPHRRVSGDVTKQRRRVHARAENPILNLRQRLTRRGQAIVCRSRHIVGPGGDPAARGGSVQERTNARPRSFGAGAPITGIERRQVGLLPRRVRVRLHRPATVHGRPAR